MGADVIYDIRYMIYDLIYTMIDNLWHMIDGRCMMCVWQVPEMYHRCMICVWGMMCGVRDMDATGMVHAWHMYRRCIVGVAPPQFSYVFSHRAWYLHRRWPSCFVVDASRMPPLAAPKFRRAAMEGRMKVRKIRFFVFTLIYRELYYSQLI